MRIPTRYFVYSIALSVSWYSALIAQLEEKKSAPPIPPVVQLGRIDSPLILESSGLAICATRANAIWTHNDSANASAVYLLSTSGQLLANVAVSGINNLDWEAMCGAVINGQRYLVIGDVGDNLERRTSCFIYLFPEPNIAGETPVVQKVKPIRLEFRYPDGPHNCEAIGFDQLSNKLWLVEKRYVDDDRKTRPGVFSLPLQLTDTKRPIVANRIGNFPVRNVTGMDFSPDGERLIIRNYLNAHLYTRKNEMTWRETIASQTPKPIVLPIQRQGEAICFTADSKSVIVTSEVRRQPIWQVNLDATKPIPENGRNQ